MTQTIDPEKLKAAAAHLEWVLHQYPESEDVKNLLRALLPLIEAAKAGSVKFPIDRVQIPGAYNFADCLYIPYNNPSVGGAYAQFITEMEGGTTELDNQILSYIKDRFAAV